MTNEDIVAALNSLADISDMALAKKLADASQAVADQFPYEAVNTVAELAAAISMTLVTTLAAAETYHDNYAVGSALLSGIEVVLNICEGFMDRADKAALAASIEAAVTPKAA